MLYPTANRKAAKIKVGVQRQVKLALFAACFQARCCETVRWTGRQTGGWETWVQLLLLLAARVIQDKSLAALFPHHLLNGNNNTNYLCKVFDVCRCRGLQETNCTTGALTSELHLVQESAIQKDTPKREQVTVPRFGSRPHLIPLLFTSHASCALLGFDKEIISQASSAHFKLVESFPIKRATLCQPAPCRVHLLFTDRVVQKS